MKSNCMRVFIKSGFYSGQLTYLIDENGDFLDFGERWEVKVLAPEAHAAHLLGRRPRIDLDTALEIKLKKQLL